MRKRRVAMVGVLLLVAAGTCAWSLRLHRLRENQRIVREAARRVGIAPDLLLAVAEVESGFTADARSARGAVGLLQLLPETAAEQAVRLRLGPIDLLDPRDNAMVGAGFLEFLLRRYRGDEAMALAAYQAGPGHADAWLAQGRGLPGPETVEQFAPAVTRDYVDRVLSARRVWPKDVIER